jgi:hypothetical protein
VALDELDEFDEAAAGLESNAGCAAD